MDVPNIPDIWQRCKVRVEPWIGEIGPILLLFLVAIGSFGLGRLSLLEATRPAISVASVEMDAKTIVIATGGLIVASKSGTAYHFPWCGGASQIKPENRIWFADEEAAQKAGYTPSKSCKGLTEVD